MSSDLSRTQSGFSLLYVLITISALSALLIHHAYMKTVREDRRAFEYSVAQLQNVLNLANAYYLENGHWPKDNSDVCSTPDTEISNMVTLTNGWGNNIVGSGDCSDGDSIYELYQVIPDKYYNRFTSLLDEDVSRDYSGTPSGFSRLFVRVDRQVVAGGRFIDVKVLPDRTPPSIFNPVQGPPLHYPYQVCQNGTETFFVALDGMCLEARDPLFQNPPAPTVIGYAVDIGNWWGERSIAYSADTQDNSLYSNGDYFSNDLYDFARYRCPSGWNNFQSEINVLYVAWCE